MYDKQRIWSGATDNGGFIAAAIYRFGRESWENEALFVHVLRANFARLKSATKKRATPFSRFAETRETVGMISFVNGFKLNANYKRARSLVTFLRVVAIDIGIIPRERE